MGKKHRLAVAFTSYTLAGTALACAVSGQNAILVLSEVPLVLQGSHATIAVTGINANLATGVAIPSWVPAAGVVSSFSTLDAAFANSFASLVAPYYDSFYAGMWSAYSNAVPNPHMGTHGSLFFSGGGHSATNWNGRFAIVTDDNLLRFVLLNEASPYFGTGTDATTKARNNHDSGSPPVAAMHETKCDWDWGDTLAAVESTPKPPSPHSYCCGDIIAPSAGGGTYGTYFSVVHNSPGYVGYLTSDTEPNKLVTGAHYLPLENDAGTTGNVWARAGAQSTSQGTGETSLGPIPLSCYVPGQDRTYWGTSSSGSLQRWFDHTTGTHELGTGATVRLQGGDGNCGKLIAVDERDMVVFFGVNSGQLRAAWLDSTDSDPAASTVTLSSTIYANGTYAWDHVVWCTDLQRFLVFNTRTSGGVLETDVYYEVEIPTPASGTWTVTQKTLVSGTLPPLADSAGDWQGWHWLPACKACVMVRHNYSTDVTTMWALRPIGV